MVQVIAEQQPSANDAHPSIRPKLRLFRAVNLKLAKRAYKQIQSSQQQLSTRLQAIASQLSTADAELSEFVGAAFTCIGTQGGDVVKHLMGELAAANTRADKAEAEAVDF